YLLPNTNPGLTMSSFIDLVGSGEGATIIRGGASSNVISMQGDTALRNLTIEVTDATTLHVLDLPDASAGRRIANVTISASTLLIDGSSEFRGISDETDDPLLVEECTITVQTETNTTAIAK